MPLSTGTRSVVSEGFVWGIGVLLIAGSVIYFRELKTATASLFGLKPPAARVAAEDVKPAPLPDNVRIPGAVELKAGPDGHYAALADVNGRSIHVLVDTGATMVALTYEDAQKAGIYLKDSDFTMRSSTANGTARIAPVTLGRVSIGDITVHNVAAAVAESGKLDITLLGMSFLSRLSRVDMRSGTLVLQD